jgi:hypothetical protein
VRWSAGAILRAGGFPAPTALAVEGTHHGKQHDDDTQETGDHLGYILQQERTDGDQERREYEPSSDMAAG